MERSALALNVGLVVDLFRVSQPGWVEAHRTTPFGVNAVGMLNFGVDRSAMG